VIVFSCAGLAGCGFRKIKRTLVNSRIHRDRERQTPGDERILRYNALQLWKKYSSCCDLQQQ
jgi:hypothetical protein